ncbi:MAG TPA: IclR family transcriptional regulator [Microbacterium sp.]|nr:IclR family transcriptional regulator [Microbacterium sp.]
MTAAKTPNAAGNKRLNAAGLRRDLQLLDVLGSPESSQTGGLGVLRVAELVGRDKAIVSRSLATLAESGLVERDPQTGLYRLGHRLYSLAARTFESTLARTSLPYLRRLVAALHETTHLCVLRGGSVLTLLSEVSDYNFRGLGWEGVSVPALHTSSGRVLLSDWEREDLAAWYERHKSDEWVPHAPREASAQGLPVPQSRPRPSITDFDGFSAEIARIRERGYATVDEEFEAGVVGVSAPVFDFRGRVIAALNVSAPKMRLGAHLEQAGQATAKIAAALSRRMGHGSDPRDA